MGPDHAAQPIDEQAIPRERYISLTNTRLDYREIGQGQPMVVLHGGPDFSNAYLLPDLPQ